MVREYEIDPTYRRDSGLWSLVTNSIDFPDGFTVAETNVVEIPAGEMGGNHTHPRIEAFIALGELALVWQDDQQTIYHEPMTPKPGGKLRLFYIEPNTPHTVVNEGEGPAWLIEFADGPQHDVVPFPLVSNS